MNIFSQMSLGRFEIQIKLVCYGNVNFFSKIIYFFLVLFFICMIIQRVFKMCMYGLRNNHKRSTHVITTQVKIHSYQDIKWLYFMLLQYIIMVSISFLQGYFSNLLGNDLCQLAASLQSDLW